MLRLYSAAKPIADQSSGMVGPFVGKKLRRFTFHFNATQRDEPGVGQSRPRFRVKPEVRRSEPWYMGTL